MFLVPPYLFSYLSIISPYTEDNQLTMSRSANCSESRNVTSNHYDDGLQVANAPDSAGKQVVCQERSNSTSFVQLVTSQDEKEAYNVDLWNKAPPGPLEATPGAKRRSWIKSRWACALIVLLIVILGGVAAGVTVSVMKKRDQTQRYLEIVQDRIV